MADISKIKLPDGTTYNLKDASGADTKVTQTAADSTNASFPILLAGTADGTTRTEGAKKSPKLAFNPQTTGLEIGSGSFVYTKLASGGLYLYSTGETNPSIEMHPGSLVVGKEGEGHTTIVGGSGGLVLTDTVVCKSISVDSITDQYTFTKSSGNWSLFASEYTEIYKSGNVVHMSLCFKGNGSSVSSGSNGFVGTMSGGPLPITRTMLFGWYSGSILMCAIEPDGAITARAYTATCTLSSASRGYVNGTFICADMPEEIEGGGIEEP